MCVGGVVNVLAEDADETVRTTYMLHKFDNGTINICTLNDGIYTVATQTGITYSDETSTLTLNPNEEFRANILIDESVGKEITVSISENKVLNGSIGNNSSYKVTIKSKGLVTGPLGGDGAGGLELDGGYYYWVNSAYVTIRSGKFKHNPIEGCDENNAPKFAEGSHLAEYKTETKDYADINYPYEVYSSGANLSFPEISDPEGAVVGSGKWYIEEINEVTAESTHTEVTAESTLAKDTVFVKMWAYTIEKGDGEGNPDHFIVDKTQARWGETVTITPAENYKLTWRPHFHYKGEDSWIDTQKSTDGKYTFEMPCHAVIVTAEPDSMFHTVSVYDQFSSDVKIIGETSFKEGEPATVQLSVANSTKYSSIQSIGAQGAWGRNYGSDEVQFNAETGVATFIMNTDDVTIYPYLVGKPYALTSADTVKSDYTIYTADGVPVNDDTKPKYGDWVWANVKPVDSQNRVTKISVYKTGDEETAVPEAKVDLVNSIVVFEMPDYPVTIKAEVKPESELTTYWVESNGGSGEQEMKWKLESTTKLTDLPKLWREGYAFQNWTTDQAGNNVIENDLRSVKEVDGKYTIYAQWKINAYTIIFDANTDYDDVTGTMDNQSVKYGSNTPLSANTFTREGYTFQGWSESWGYNNKVDYSDKSSTDAVTEHLVDGGQIRLYAVWKKNSSSEGTKPAKVKAANTEVKNEAPDYPKDSNEAKLKNSVVSAITNGTTPSANADVLNTAANTIAQNNEVTEKQATQELAKAGITPREGDTVSVVVQPYLDVKLEKVSAEEDGNNSFTLDITPMYRKVATTVDPSTSTEIVTQGDMKNAVTLEEHQRLTVTKPVAMTIPLPAGFSDQGTLYVNHVKDDGASYVYKGSVTGDAAKSLEFINPNGFSKFTISKTDPTVAKIGDVSYGSLQTAVDAVRSGQIITLQKDVEANSKVTVGRTVTFTIDKNGKTFDADKNIVAGSNTTLTKTLDGTKYTYTFTYTAPSSGDSTVSSYAVTAASATNGTVSVSPANAAKGATVTVTLKPNDGYKVDKLTVTDKGGAAVAVTRKSDTEYTFIMPGSAVTVTGTFAKEDAPIAFTDIKDSDYFYDAVKWAVQNGLTSGTTPTTFSPYDTCTRAQVITFLYHLAGSPAVDKSAAAKLTDVPADKWYADAVAWALANGITAGTTPETFGPDDPCTRAQAMTFIYRYEKNPEPTKGMTFSDVKSGIFYADAVSWAAENGITIGTTPETFSPDNSCPRAQVITFLYRNATK